MKLRVMGVFRADSDPTALPPNDYFVSAIVEQEGKPGYVPLSTRNMGKEEAEQIAERLGSEA